MNAYLPPLVIDVHVRREGSRDVRVWFPFVLLWPLLAIIVGFALLVAALVDLALLLSGARYHRYSLLVLGTLGLLAACRGTHVNARSTDSRVHVDIY
ncbi:hypothetical protein EG835_00805 [bacterium]|nr:hypothetical protein [bacterium]